MAYRKLAIFGVPRSGTSWLGEIINSSPRVCYKFQPLFSYAHKSYLTINSRSKSIDNFFERLHHCTDPFTNQAEERALGSKPLFKKSSTEIVAFKEVRYLNLIESLLANSKDLMVLGLVRNPLSVLTSWINAPREFRHDLNWNIDDEWLLALSKNCGRDEEYYGYAKWQEYIAITTKMSQEYPARFLRIKYEDLLADPLSEVIATFDFLGLPLDEQVQNFVKTSTSTHHHGTYSVFRDRSSTHASRILLPKHIVTKIKNDPTFIECYGKS